MPGLREGRVKLGEPILALCGMIAAASAFAAEPEPVTISATAEAACKKAMDPDEDADVQTAHYIGCVTHALALNPGLYFRNSEDPAAPNEPGGIVDVVHSGGRAGWSWSFAIDRACPAAAGFPRTCKGEDERVVLRLVRLKRLKTVPPELRAPTDASVSAIKAHLDARFEWLEADIRRCPRAASTLLALERVQWFAFLDWDRSSIMGGHPTELVVPGGDGPATVVRASSFASNYVAEDFGDSGGASAWAKQMMKVIEPCLKPSAAPPPWRRD
jgi:hypothetical protein